MAREAKIVKNNKRIALVAANREKREELRTKSKQGDPVAQKQLSKMARDSSYIRIRNRDEIDGRPRGYMRRFGVSRVKFRKLAHEGKLPGVKKASW